ncbi:MAG TPA: biopolymer transporter ExbD [Polyangiales bacterium]|jgi:biopolymer transport protein ExbD|nr:biopolymer transporter ExbD [Polyangiales bacterium]
MKPVRKITMIKPQAEVQSSINVTPLVDVVLVLLIIFMVVMPLKEKDFGVRIPTQEQVEIPSEVPPDQIIVDITKNGDFMLNGMVIPRDSYVPALQTRLSNAAQRIVFVSPHAEAAYPKLIEAFEGARAAGAETLAMLPDVDSVAAPVAAAPTPEAAAPTEAAPAAPAPSP